MFFLKQQIYSTPIFESYKNNKSKDVRMNRNLNNFKIFNFVSIKRHNVIYAKNFLLGYGDLEFMKFQCTLIYQQNRYSIKLLLNYSIKI